MPDDAPPPDHVLPTIQWVPLRPLTVYQITEQELDQLEKGTPESTYFGFSVFLLSSGTSFLVSLLTADLKSERLFSIFSVFAAVGIVGGLLLMVIWLRQHRSTSHIAKVIRDSKPPDTGIVKKSKSQEIGELYLLVNQSQDLIIVDGRNALQRNEPVSVNVSRTMPVWTFLHLIRNKFEPDLLPYTYNTQWLLYSPITDRTFSDIGINRLGDDGKKFDTRTLEDIGIYNKDKLVEGKLEIRRPN